MCPEEVSADLVGDDSLVVRSASIRKSEGKLMECDEQHHDRFLTPVFGPERERGSHRCNSCGQYFELPPQGLVPKFIIEQPRPTDYSI